MLQKRFITDAPITSSLSNTQSTGNTKTTTLASQNTFLSHVEEDHNKKLDNEIEQIVTSFRDIVKSSAFNEMVRMPGRSEDRVYYIFSSFSLVNDIEKFHKFFFL
jgi:hypothetical protein